MAKRCIPQANGSWARWGRYCWNLSLMGKFCLVSLLWSGQDFLKGEQWLRIPLLNPPFLAPFTGARPTKQPESSLCLLSSLPFYPFSLEVSCISKSIHLGAWFLEDSNWPQWYQESWEKTAGIMGFEHWLIDCLTGNEDPILRRMGDRDSPWKSDSESFTSGYLNRYLGGKEHPCQPNDTEVHKKCKDFMLYLNAHQKACTMKEALKNQFDKLTQPLTLASFHPWLSRNWHDRHMFLWQRLWKHMCPISWSLTYQSDLAVAASECPSC